MHSPTARRWAALIDQADRSGLTRREFAAKAGVNPNTLSWWRWKLKQGSSGGATTRFQAATAAKVEILAAQIERLTKHFDFLEKKRQLAKAERFIASENQALLFADAPVELPPRDATVERDDQDRPTGDKR